MNAKKMANTAIFMLKKHAPEILLACGIGCTVAGVVTAISETRKVDDILEPRKEKITEIRESDVEKKEKAIALTKEYLKTGYKVFALYAPTVIFETAGVACVLSSHGILKKRNAALAVGYSALNKAFTEYRQRVVDKYGLEDEEDIYRDAKEIEVKEEYTDEKGKKKTRKVKKKVYNNPLGLSPFAKIFDENNPLWSRSPDTNVHKVYEISLELNDRLRAYGYLFLNDAYEAFGYPKTPEGQIYGWVFDPDGEEHDNYVDVGLTKKINKEFLDGFEPSCILDFNVENIVDIFEEYDFKTNWNYSWRNEEFRNKVRG